MPDSAPNVAGVLQLYLAFPIVIALYLFWKIYTRDWRPWIRLSEMDLVSGARLLNEDEIEPEDEKTWGNLPLRIVRGLF